MLNMLKGMFLRLPGGVLIKIPNLYKTEYIIPIYIPNYLLLPIYNSEYI